MLGIEGVPVDSVAWSPDGRRLATANVDGAARLWDVARSEALMTLYGHESAVSDVAWSTDGKRLATASFDGTVRQYAIDTGLLMATARRHVTRSLTPEECMHYLHVRTCPPIPEIPTR
jgi:WD40 repeat protein